MHTVNRTVKETISTSQFTVIKRVLPVRRFFHHGEPAREKQKRTVDTEQTFNLTFSRDPLLFEVEVDTVNSLACLN